MTNKQSNPDSSFESDPQANVHGRHVTPDEASYRDGYVKGQFDQNSPTARDQYAREQISESNGMANGLVIGLVLAAIAGVVGGTVYYYNRTETAPTPVAAPASPQPQQRTTVIERTIERTKEAAPNVQVPNVQINVPQPSPVINNPATAPVESQPEASTAEPSGQPLEATDSSKSEATQTDRSAAPSASENPENKPEGGTQN
jgi:hypothetical protein